MGRRAAAAVAALALLAAAAGVVAAAGSRPLLQTGELQVSERVFLIGASVKRQQESPEERSRRLEGQLLRLRRRLVLATAGARRGLDKDPRVLQGLDDFRVASLVEAYLEGEVRAPARKTAAGAARAPEIERRTAELSSRAAVEFPAEIDEALFAAARRGEGAGDVVIARAAGRAVPASSLWAGLAKVSHPDSREAADEGVARSLLEQRLTRLRIAALAERAGYAARPVHADLEMEQRIRLLADAYARDVIYPKVAFTAEELAAYYERTKEQLRRNGEKEIFAIVVKDPDAAKAIAARLAAGADFTAEAKAHTEGPGRERGGFIGFLLPEDVPAPLKWAIRDIQAGQTSKVVRMPSGNHILYCARLVDGRVPVLDEVREALGVNLRQELQERALEAEAARLETEIKVQVDETLMQELMKSP